jgi:hypothetical protein
MKPVSICLVFAVLFVTNCPIAAGEKLNCDLLLKDGEGAVMTSYDNLTGVRYCEYLLTCITSDGPKTNVYFTTGLNNETNPMDTCANFVDTNAEQIKAEYGVVGVFKNGPRGWLFGSVDVPTGVVRDFQGVKAVWESTLQADPSSLKTTPYQSAVVARDSKIVFPAAKPLFILNDPTENSSWVMKSWSEIVDHTLSYQSLPELGEKLKLPEGWSFHVYTPEKDFMISAINGNAHIIQDELLNTYDGCYEEDGKSSCTFQPDKVVK